jgi:hypothetical protein
VLVVVDGLLDGEDLVVVVEDLVVIDALVEVDDLIVVDNLLVAATVLIRPEEAEEEAEEQSLTTGTAAIVKAVQLKFVGLPSLNAIALVKGSQLQNVGTTPSDLIHPSAPAAPATPSTDLDAVTAQDRYR